MESASFFHKLQNNICRSSYLKICALFQIRREDSPCDAQIDSAHFLIYSSSKIHRKLLFKLAAIKWKAITASILAFTQRKQASLRCAVYNRLKRLLSKNEIAYVFEAKPVHFHRSAFSFVHLRRSPDCPSLKKLSSLCESEIANTYVDKGSSDIAHKYFSAAVAKYFHIEFSKILTFTSIFKTQLSLKNSVSHENVVCGSEQTIYK